MMLSTRQGFVQQKWYPTQTPQKKNTANKSKWPFWLASPTPIHMPNLRHLQNTRKTIEPFLWVGHAFIHGSKHINHSPLGLPGRPPSIIRFGTVGHCWWRALLRCCWFCWIPGPWMVLEIPWKDKYIAGESISIHFWANPYLFDW